MPRVKVRSSWPRLEIYLPDEEIRRRVKLAAAVHNVKLGEYCVGAILERLEQDERSTSRWLRRSTANCGQEIANSTVPRRIKRLRSSGLEIIAHRYGLISDHR
jgi:hypothetical protein